MRLILLGKLERAYKGFETKYVGFKLASQVGGRRGVQLFNPGCGTDGPAHRVHFNPPPLPSTTSTTPQTLAAESLSNDWPLGQGLCSFDVLPSSGLLAPLSGGLQERIRRTAGSLLVVGGGASNPWQDCLVWARCLRGRHVLGYPGRCGFSSESRATLSLSFFFCLSLRPPLPHPWMSHLTIHEEQFVPYASISTDVQYPQICKSIKGESRSYCSCLLL